MADKSLVVVAMSGGVDSSVAAKMMVEAGYRCVGMTMRLYKGDEAESSSCSTQSCCGEESVDDARLVAEALNIPYYPINFREEFWEQVVKVFAKEYFSGRTPSPCILCNERLKFDSLYKKALEMGASYVCTGHYARTAFDEKSGRWNLLRGIDQAKDQSYFLFSMTQEQLAKTLFPVGGYAKPQIREFAEAGNLITAKKRESQDICFIPDGNYAAFLERNFPELVKEAKGMIRHLDGTVLGEHQGIHSVTVGQRKGLGVAFGKPIYVTHIDPHTREVTVGDREDALRPSMSLSRVNWILKDPQPGEEFSVSIKIRSRGPEPKATVIARSGGKADVFFQTPQLAVTPGQAAVFYEGEKVFGGGWID